MKIVSASVDMAASHSSVETFQRSERLRIGSSEDSRRRQAVALPPPAPVSSVQISEAARLAQASEADAATAAQASQDALANDPVLSLIRAVLSMLTGHEIEVFDARELTAEAAPAQTPTPAAPRASDAPPAARRSFTYERHELYRESEQTQFAAAGVVHTEDGRTISFDLSLSMSRSFERRLDISVAAGEARQKKDPLVLNFAGTAAQLTSRRFDFDLDADGSLESINFVGAGSGFLAIDRNGDGEVNDGSELFGTRSGDGFADLAGADVDANGWIDENDAIYDDLRVWSKDGAGEDALLTLAEAGVGAIGLRRIATPFALKDGDNALQGDIRTSGVFLHEDGRAGSVQQIDLTV